ncbi:MAG TPA: S8 family serine peptidase [Vicinamibacterales bacterium]
MTRFLAAVSAAVLAATVMPYAQSAQSVPLAESESPSLWFVELSSPPTAEGTSVQALEREETNFHAAATGAGVRYTERRHFRDLWNGLTVRANKSDADKLRGLPGVQSVYPVVKVKIAQESTQPNPATDLITAIKMTGVDIAQNELGLTGRGVRVAIMDTGIDYDHPDLGGCFGPGCRVEAGWDLVGDDFNADDANPVIAPDPFPDDCAGHGTHVAGIVGANGGIRGVAPDVTFHAYRVFGCVGTTTSDIMLDAMEMIARDNVDVLNMSIGAPLQWPEYPTAKASNRLVRRGIVVVSSIGNEADLGLYAAAAPGIGRDVIGVASFDNTNANLVAFTISPDGTAIGYIASDSPAAPPTSGAFPMARTGTVTTADDACNPLAAGSLTGQVALIRRGTCSFYQKSINAQNAGAVSVVIYNNATGFITPTVAGTPAVTIPVVSITAIDGGTINSRLAGGPVTMTWTNSVASEPNPTGNLISSFSSWGLAADLSFKPDIGAPGGTIRSTLPLEQGGYGNLSGTSMASPHIAGAAALLLQARPRTKPAEVQERLQNTARPHPFGSLTSSFIDAVHRQGAGMLQIDDAVTSDVVISPSSLALGEIESGSVTKFLRLKDDSDDRNDHRWCRHHRRDHHDDDEDEPVTYTLGHQPAIATGSDTFAVSLFASFATVTFSEPTVTIGGRHRRNDAALVAVTITPPGSASPARLFGGYITLTPDDGGPVLRVPYAGYNGDYQAIQALTPTPNNFPWLAKLEGSNLFNQPNGATYTMQDGDVPYILVHLNHQVAAFTMEVFDVATGRSLNFADDEKFVGRNSSATSFFALTWDGTTFRRPNGRTKTVPNGTYRIEVSILKALGDPRNPAHFERWTSPDITIARP